MPPIRPVLQRSWPLVLGTLALAGSRRDAVAQVGGEAAIAPLAPGAVTPADPLERSQWFNLPDGRWNYGEAAVLAGVDVGGVLGADPAPPEAFGYTVDLLGTGWTPFSTPAPSSLRHRVGEIRRPPAQPPTEFAASYELIGPDPLPSGAGRYAVVVFSVPPTHVPLDKPDQAPFSYPGDASNYGLWSARDSSTGNWFRYPWPGIDRVVEHFRPGAGSRDYDVFGAYIVPAASHRPLVSTMQRYRQLREIVIRHLVDDLGYDATKIGFLVAGGSYGGLPAHLFPLLYPDEFHAGFDSAFHPSVRTVINDQDSYDFYSTALGRGNSGAGYTLADMTDFPIFCRIEGTDYKSLSLLNRLVLNRDLGGGHVLRPVYLLSGDVDPVTHGNDWVKIVDPSATNLRFGRYTPISTALHPPHIWWSVVGKACHGDNAVGEPFTIFKTSGSITTHDVTDALWEMVPEARKQIDVTITAGMRPPPLVPLAASLATLEPHDHVLARPARPDVPTAAGLLQEVPAFRRHGHGTYTGWKDSLVVRGGSVYVGSADGVIHRFARDVIAPGTLEPLREMAQSNDAGADFDIGYGAWALQVADVDGDAQDEVVAASYKRIAILDASTLALEAVADAPFGQAAPAFEYAWPRRLQIAEINPANPGMEIVCTTLHGRLLVLDQNLSVLAWHGEGGIRDLVVGPTPTPHLPSSDFDRPIYGMSARGHVFALEMDTTVTSGPQGKLVAASSLQYGRMIGLEPVQWAGQPRVAGLYGTLLGPSSVPSSGTQTTAVRIFDADTLQVVDEFGSLENPGGLKSLYGPLVAGNEGSFAVAQSGGTTYIVALFQRHLVIWDDTKTLVGLKNLESFAPARGAVAVATGDLDGNPGDEIVISTLAGHVVWLQLSDVLDTSPPFRLSILRKVDPGATTFYDHRTNSTLAATWAMAADPVTNTLRAVDATGAWWRINPTNGVPIGTAISLEVALPRSVSRIVWAGPNAQKMKLEQGGVGVSQWAVNPMGPARRVTTKAYLPLIPSFWAPIAADSTFLFGGFWVFQQPGDALLSGGISHAAWWAPKPLWAGAYPLSYPNLVQAVRYDLAATPVPRLQALWNSTGPDLVGARPAVPSSPGDGIALRTEYDLADIWSHQACRIGRVDPGLTAPQAVVSGLDGVVMLLETRFDGSHAPQPIRTQSADYGFGGMALALGDFTGDGFDEVVFAPYYDTVDSAGNDATATLRVLTHDGTNFVPHLTVPMPTGAGALGYAPSGIALHDFTADGVPEIVVTTLTGELFVFDGSSAALLDTEYVEGAVGALNSIVIADLVGADGKAEVYVAGSMGIRRFDQ